MTRSRLLISRLTALGLLLVAPSRTFARWDGATGFSVLNFANDPGAASGRFDAQMEWLSESRVDEGRFARGEVSGIGFYETGSGGDHSLDLPYAVFRPQPWGDAQHFWLGRAHPLEEGIYGGLRTDSRSAVGANWAQNQSDPLTPRVSGWIGVGYRTALPGTGLSLTGAFSPVYLPSFGPRIEYSDRAETAGSRFGRLPPQQVWLDSATELPLRYRIESGDLKSILLQNQFFISIDHFSRVGTFALLAWSAPSPNPETSVSGAIQVNSNDANVLVTAQPSFPRQNFTGVLWRNSTIGFQPEVQVLREWASATTTVSAEFRPFEFLRIGVLHTFLPYAAQPNDGGGMTIDSPRFANQLVWVDLKHRFERVRLAPNLRWERHFEIGRQDWWLRPSVLYEPLKELGILASVTVITGDDKSYLGVWRDLDSAQAGVQYRW